MYAAFQAAKQSIDKEPISGSGAVDGTDCGQTLKDLGPKPIGRNDKLRRTFRINDDVDLGGAASICAEEGSKWLVSYEAGNFKR
jgi:hypothetical protein